MSMVRRAFLFATIERYLVMALNLAMVPILSRLMGPTEFGVSVLGLAALMIADVVRDFGGTAYIVQQKELTLPKIQTVFTISLILTGVMAAALFVLAKPVADFYRTDGLAYYLRVVAACYLFGPIVTPIHALQRRDMEFGTIATITAISTVTNVVTTIALAYVGFSYMSFAWANLVSGAVGAFMGLYFRPEFSVFRVTLAEWRNIIRFGRYDALSNALSALWDFVPYLVLGRVLDPQAVGLYQRAVTIANLPRRTLLGGVAAIILSTMSMKIREGEEAKQSYFKAIRLVTALHWPSLIAIVLLAYPIVSILLGSRWLEVVPIVQVVCLALMLNYSVVVTYSTLLSIGQARDAAIQFLIVVPLSTVVVYIAAQHGLPAVAASMFITVSLDAAVATYFLRRHLHFTFGELVVQLRASFLVAAVTAIGPLSAIALNGFDMRLGLVSGSLAAAIAGAGWLCALYLTDHPLFFEIRKLLEVIQQLIPFRLLALEQTRERS
jgi:O-antigen/teichoic acid export membrane protein